MLIKLTQGTTTNPIIMQIEQKELSDTGEFFITGESGKVASMIYKKGDDVLDILHTEVDPSLQGKNVGKDLVNHAVAFAREKGIKIKASCSYVQAVFKKRSEELNDIIVKN
jgi:predicted GNAT family acetyltransferase